MSLWDFMQWGIPFWMARPVFHVKRLIYLRKLASIFHFGPSIFVVAILLLYFNSSQLMHWTTFMYRLHPCHACAKPSSCRRLGGVPSQPKAHESSKVREYLSLLIYCTTCCTISRSRTRWRSTDGGRGQSREDAISAGGTSDERKGDTAAARTAQSSAEMSCDGWIHIKRGQE